jgi:spore maturation protein CgeB
MNVLYFGSTDETAGALHYYNSLARAGHTVLAFDPRYFDTAGPVEKLRRHLNGGPLPARREAVARRLKEVCRTGRFDLVFVMAENFLSGETIREIRSAASHPMRFLYHSHDNNYSDGILKPAGFFRETLPEYDFVFTTKSQNVERYRRDGARKVHYVPSAYEPALHRPLAPEESRLGSRSFDVTFVGTYDRSRDNYVDTLGWERLHVWGNAWNRYPGYAKTRDRIFPRAIYYLELADVLGRSKVALGLLREEAEDLHTQRTFEIPACGALQLAPRNEEILSFFEEDEEIVCFSSAEEMREKALHYLANDEAARKIARAGRKRCLEGRHTYDDRVAQMMAALTSAKAGPRPV